MADNTVVLIARAGESTWILYNALSKQFNVHVLLESPPSKRKVIRSRIRRLGAVRVFGQLLFQFMVVLPLSRFSAGRRKEIVQEFGISVKPPPASETSGITSVNASATWSLVKSLSPRVIVINGTRILSKATLNAFNIPVLNTHVGITPKYRGVHGAYWALANKDPQHCGVTVHLVDTGIDTGGILHQALITPTKKDNFSTYPTMQMAVGSTLLQKAIEEVIEGNARTISDTGDSKRWYHPSLVEYLGNLIRLGVR